MPCSQTMPTPLFGKLEGVLRTQGGSIGDYFVYSGMLSTLKHYSLAIGCVYIQYA